MDRTTRLNGGQPLVKRLTILLVFGVELPGDDGWWWRFRGVEEFGRWKQWWTVRKNVSPARGAFSLSPRCGDVDPRRTTPSLITLFASIQPW
jgi:hypothetical protein